MLLRNTNEIKSCLVTLVDVAAVVYTIYICRHKWEFKFKKLISIFHPKQIVTANKI